MLFLVMGELLLRFPGRLEDTAPGNPAMSATCLGILVKSSLLRLFVPLFFFKNKAITCQVPLTLRATTRLDPPLLPRRILESGMNRDIEKIAWRGMQIAVNMLLHRRQQRLRAYRIPIRKKSTKIHPVIVNI